MSIPNQKLPHQKIPLRAVTACMALVLWTQSVSAQNLLVQWNFDEQAGGTTDALDGGQAPDTTGVLGSTATRSSDVPGGGKGFSLDVSAPGEDTSIVNGGNPLEVDTLTQFTLSTWIKVTSETDYNEGGSGNVRLLAKQSGGLFDGFSWNLNAPTDTGGGAPVRSNNAFRMGLFVGGNTEFAFSQADDNILDRGGDWLFLAVTYDGTQTSQNAIFYVGDETNAVAQLGSIGDLNAGQVFSTNTANGGVANANFGVGFTDAAPGVDFALSGLQDDVRVYDGVLDLEALDAVRLENLGSETSIADLNLDGFVDGLDLGILLGEWNPAVAAAMGITGGAAVPEPSTAILLLTSLTGLLAARRR